MPTTIAVDAMGADRAPKPEVDGAILAARHYDVQVLLASPVKLICREDCKGLCPQCGTNLNNATCNCQQPGDPRWAALGELKNKLQS